MVQKFGQIDQVRKQHCFSALLILLVKSKDNLVVYEQEKMKPEKANSSRVILNLEFKPILCRYVNRKQISNSSRVNLLYSTPSCYLNEVHKTRKPLSVKTDDFFPYASDPHAFWTGYFTSRPTFKYFVQRANNFLQVCKQLAVGAFSGHPKQSIIEKVWTFSEPVAIAQHHGNQNYDGYLHGQQLFFPLNSINILFFSWDRCGIWNC